MRLYQQLIMGFLLCWFGASLVGLIFSYNMGELHQERSSHRKEILQLKARLEIIEGRDKIERVKSLSKTATKKPVLKADPKL